MKKTLLSMVAAAALFTTATAAMAQDAHSGFYAGAGMNYVTPTGHADNTGTIGFDAGYNFNKYLAVEFDFDNAWGTGTTLPSQTTIVNGKVGYPVGSFTPYVMIGTGYDFAPKTKNNTMTTNPVYDLGAGVEYSVTSRIGLDLRYTYVDTYNTPNHSANMFGMNVNYKF
jgi:opacity protein-like surface antigen